MQNYLKLIGTTVAASILLLIFGVMASSSLLDLTHLVVGAKLHILSPLEPSRFWVSIGLLFASCGLFAAVLCLAEMAICSTPFSTTRYAIFSVVTMMAVLVGIGLRLWYLTTLPVGSMGLPLSELHFFTWGLTVNLSACGIIMLFIIISRFR